MYVRLHITENYVGKKRLFPKKASIVENLIFIISHNSFKLYYNSLENVR